MAKQSKAKAAALVAAAVKAKLEEVEPQGRVVVTDLDTAQGRFPKNLKEIREHAGFSQIQTGASIGCSSVHISLMEAGKRGVSLELIDRLAQLFKVEPQAFFTPIGGRK